MAFLPYAILLVGLLAVFPLQGIFEAIHWLLPRVVASDHADE